MESIAKTAVELMKSRGLTISTAESCTGGLASARITSVSGASEVLSFSMVTYSNEAKAERLGVNRQTLDEHGAVSRETAGEMAEQIRRLSGSDVGVGITGVAGPNSSEGKPVGLVFVAISLGEKTTVKELSLSGDREQIRQASVDEALRLVIEAVKGEPDATKK